MIHIRPAFDIWTILGTMVLNRILLHARSGLSFMVSMAWSQSSSIPVFVWASVGCISLEEPKLSRRTGGTRVQGYRGTGVQGYRGTGVQGYRGTGAQGYGVNAPSSLISIALFVASARKPFWS